MPHLFVSYARRDVGVVRTLIEPLDEEFRRRPLAVTVWMDLEDLPLGRLWTPDLARAVQESVVFLIFVSQASIKSDWVRRELEIAVSDPGRLIIPILLEPVPDLPRPLADYTWLDLSDRRQPRDIRFAVQRIADATEAHLAGAPSDPS